MNTLKFTFILTGFAGLLLVGCADNPLTEMTSADDSASLQEQTLAKAPVPIKENATFVADLTADPVVLDCGYGEVFFHVFNGEGIMSHFGRTTGRIVADECWVNLSDFSLGVKGTTTFTAANGDELWGVWGLKSPALPPGETLAVWDFYAYAASDPIQFTGGTGRFEGASGFASGGGTFDRATLIGTYWFDGVLSSVGSLK